MMKQEASLEQWNSLYQAAAAVTKLAPWEDFWNTDLIVIQESGKQEAICDLAKDNACNVLKALITPLVEQDGTGYSLSIS